MAVNKIGAMAILFCGMILLGANVEVTAAVRPGPEQICPLYCIIGIEYVDCDGEKTYTDCTNCCFQNGCTLHFKDGTSYFCTWPAKHELGFGKGVYKI
ncbi:unnamed protein product [Coffea canephora]|uniref:DH200=94 genomic scaffold, scaffold_3610 n=1 Tax=Coffea canephora TaxID=49390 RepID=A0A068VLA0_COFCA|nr:unnamed protein product [Coffea canephora]